MRGKTNSRSRVRAGADAEPGAAAAASSSPGVGPGAPSLWGGRFEKGAGEGLRGFGESIGFDWKLYQEDIDGSVAWARALRRAKVLTAAEETAIRGGLEEIRREIEAGRFAFRVQDEDIHMNVERALTEKIGAAAMKLHTGRSRNDQIALDMRLHVKRAIHEIRGNVSGLQESLIELAERHAGAIVPAYTHLQRAQPILFAHALLAYFEMLERDKSRFSDALERVDELPLGSAACAGTTIRIDREALAKDLGFARITANSIDAVSDRDFVVEMHSCAALLMVHLSRLAEELVIGSSEEFRYYRLAEPYTTGSSLLPQKRNPDGAELVRAKTGRVLGHLVQILAVLKGLPLAYNKDMQEDKEGLFDTLDTLRGSLRVMAGMIGGLRLDEARARAACSGALLATDLADYLVERGVPFREAHRLAGQAVRRSEETGIALRELPLADLKAICPLVGDDVRARLTPDASVAARDVPGGTAPRRVTAALAEARRRLEAGR